MVDKVFAGTVVLPDRIIDNGHVLVGDGKVPFRGIETYVRGNCVAADGKVIAEPGQGRFVSPVQAH